MKLEAVFHYLDEFLGIKDFPDYPNALNGLQVEGSGEVESLCAAVDASLATVQEAARTGADLLLVHHGLFWGGLVPVTGPMYRRLSALLEGGVALYSAHLPLDAQSCTACKSKVGKVDKLGFAEKPIDWWGYLIAAVFASGFALFIWWAFFRE